MSIAVPGSLAALMDQLVALESTVDPALRVYRWRPNGIPEMPCIYNWIGAGSFELKDQTRWRDTVTVLARICIRHTDAEEEMARVEAYGDKFRDVVDTALWKQNGPLNGAATWAQRRGLRTVLDTFNEADVLCLELPIELWLDRQIPPQP